MTRPDFGAYAAKHFPRERPDCVRAAAYYVWARHQRKGMPDVAEVRERLAEKGWLRNHLEVA